jgi:hypothetical protein
MSKIFVIAGTGEEARRWINSNIEKRAKRGETTYSLSDYCYVASPDKLRGIRDPHGVFVGNWLGRPDIFDIVQTLMMQSIHVNPALGKIYKDLQPKVRPTPKTYNQVIQTAADELAKHIDAEVLKSLMKTTTI